MSERERYTLVYYFEHDGAWTVRDSMILDFWQEMEKQDITRVSFREGAVRSGPEFVRYLKSKPCLHVYLIIDRDRDKVVWAAWVEPFSASAGYSHFCCLPEDCKGLGRRFAQMSLDAAWALKRQDGEPMYQTFLTMNYADKPHVINMCRKVGYRYIGVFSKAGFDVYEQRHVDIHCGHIQRRA